MCLAVPGKILSIAKDHVASVDFGGVTRSIQLDLTPDATIGEYVIVHAGYAIQKVSEKEAQETLAIFKEAFGS